MLTQPSFEIDLKISWAELRRRLWRGDALYTLGDRLRCVRSRRRSGLRTMNARSLLLLLLLRVTSRIVLKLRKVDPKPSGKEKVRMRAYQLKYLGTTPIPRFFVNTVAQIQRVRTYFREHKLG